ncbi:MAG: CAP domain-containing protein [Caldilinea sp.]
MRLLHHSPHLLVAFLLFFSLSMAPLPAKAQQVQPSDLFFSEVQTIYLINLERRKVGLAPLRWNRELNRSAREFAEDVVTNQPSGFCDHTDSQDRTPGERMRAAGFVRLGAWAENAVCGYTSPEAAVRAWMNSESHRRNLLDSRFREMGVGYALSATNRGYIVVDLAVDPSYAPVIIDNEAPSTPSHQVVLYIYDQATTTGFMGQGPSVEMMISNDPDFVDAAWQPYSVETEWTLSEGDGWKTVYVKTRDALGRTVVASDSIYLGTTLPREQLSSNGASYFDTGFRLSRVDAESWPQIQFSLDWIGDDSDPNFVVSPTAATTIEDNEATGGTAVQLLNGGIATVWTGGYLASLPAVAYFRAKVSDNSASQDVVKLRVMGASGDAGQLVLRAADFQSADLYQEFAVPYNLGSDARTVTFRFDRIGDVEVTFDAVTVFSSPIPVMAPLQWLSPENYLRNRGVKARFLKENGAFSPVIDVHPESGALALSLDIPAGPPTLSVTPSAVIIETAPEDQPPVTQLVVQCANCAAGAWQATTEAAWIELVVLDDGVLEIRVILDGLAPGIYQAEVLVFAPAESGLPPFVVPVTIVVGDIESLLTEKLYLPTVVR